MSAYSDLLFESAFQDFADGRRDAAESVLRLMIGAGDKDAHALYFLSHLHYLRGRYDDAAWFLAAALAIDPKHARAHNDLGETLRNPGHIEDAIPHLERAIVLEPSLAHPYGNLAAALVALDRPQDALQRARESLRRATDKAVARCGPGSVFGRLNRTREAIRQYDLALELQPGNPRAHYFRGMMRLALGQMPDARADHEGRLALQDQRFPSDTHWTGRQDLAGRTILPHAEPGTIPATVPYLAADPALYVEWSRALGTSRVFRVGLAWSGNALHAGDPGRSAALALLAPLLNRTDIACHVVQRGIVVSQMRETDRQAMRDFPHLTDHSAALTDFAQTAALIASMDLVIAVDTAVAHLAGALNIPTWVLLARDADWRWMRDRDDSPWYPSLRLFRQKQRGDWSSVIEQVGANLDQWAIGRR